MTTLFDPAVVERAMLTLAVGGPTVGLMVGLVVGRRKRSTLSWVVNATLLGALGTLPYGLWRLYCAVTDALGLDSVVNLMLQLVVFAVVGLLLGIAMLKLRRMVRNRT